MRAGGHSSKAKKLRRAWAQHPARVRFAVEALPLAERAWQVRQGDGIPLEHQAETAFVLAHALWETGGDSNHARTPGRRAAEAYAQAGRAHDDERDEVESWLERTAPRHGQPSLPALEPSQ